MKPVVCFGEILLRLSAPDREFLLQQPRLDARFGGAEANVAIALAQLGTPARVASVLPHGALGDAAIRHLRQHGVDTGAVRRAPGRLGLYYLTPGASLRASEIIYDRAGSSFALADPASFDWPAILAGAGALHLSGITPALGPGSAEAALAAAHAARAAGVIVSFDGNYRAQLWSAWDSDPKSILSELVSQADILFGNHRDMALLLDRDFSEGSAPDRAAAEAGFAAFAQLKVIASTARHAEDADRHRLSARIDTRETEHLTDEITVPGIVDRIGTGDAFAAGVLNGLLRGDGEEAAVRAGLALACLKHSLPGDASLFGAGDIEAFWQMSHDVRR